MNKHVSGNRVHETIKWKYMLTKANVLIYCAKQPFHLFYFVAYFSFIYIYIFLIIYIATKVKGTLCPWDISFYFFCVTWMSIDVLMLHDISFSSLSEIYPLIIIEYGIVFGNFVYIVNYRNLVLSSGFHKFVKFNNAFLKFRHS